MSANIAFAIGVIYTFVYYFAGRRALFDLKKVDPDYFEYLGASDGANVRNSVAIIQMLFDKGVPKRFYPGHLTKRLLIVRVMLALWPLFLAAVFFLSIVYAPAWRLSQWLSGFHRDTDHE